VTIDGNQSKPRTGGIELVLRYVSGVVLGELTPCGFGDVPACRRQPQLTRKRRLYANDPLPPAEETPKAAGDPLDVLDWYPPVKRT
jgi:hypothetical protein